MKTKKNISVVILAAGKSSRMKLSKPFLPFDEERNFIEKIMDEYIEAGISDIILVINEDIERRMNLVKSAFSRYQDIKLVVNHYPEKGRFYSIRLGLENGVYNHFFIQNTDNPFISRDLLNAMIGQMGPSGYVVASFHDQEGHPVLLGSGVKDQLLKLEGYEHNLRNQLQSFNKIRVEWPDQNILANINTREEYGKYFLSCECSY